MFLWTIFGQFHYLPSTPFLFTFSCVCQIYVADVLIIHFCNYYHLRLLSPYEYQSEINFFGGQLWIQIQFWFHICVVLLMVHSISGSSPIYVSLYIMWGNCFEYQQSYVIFKIEHFIPYFYLSQYYLLYVYINHVYTFQVQF